MEKVLALLATRRSFDCASRDETARGFAQDDRVLDLEKDGNNNSRSLQDDNKKQR